MATSKQSDMRVYKPPSNAHQLRREDLCKERDVILDLYKHHLQLLLNANVFIYAVTGALLSFVFTHLDVAFIRSMLVFPILFCVVFAVFFLLARRDINNSQEELKMISAALSVNTYPRMDALPLGLLVSAIALSVVAALIVAGAFLIR